MFNMNVKNNNKNTKTDQKIFKISIFFISMLVVINFDV